MKIDEDVYEILEGVFATKEFAAMKNPLGLTYEQQCRISQFFVHKMSSRFQRELRIDNFYRDKRLEQLQAQPKSDELKELEKHRDMLLQMKREGLDVGNELFATVQEIKRVRGY